MCLTFFYLAFYLFIYLFCGVFKLLTFPSFSLFTEASIESIGRQQAGSRSRGEYPPFPLVIYSFLLVSWVGHFVFLIIACLR